MFFAVSIPPKLDTEIQASFWKRLGQELWRYQGMIFIVICWALRENILALSYRLLGSGGDFCILFLLAATLGTALLSSFDSAREYWHGKPPRNLWNYFAGVIANRIYAFFAFSFMLVPGLDIQH
ncbi:hypothetical protein BH09VER1_BH09VER1_04920 [soil metagenome]